MTRVEREIAEDRAYYAAAEYLTEAERRDALAWCDAGCPGDEPTDVDFEEGDFA